MDIERAVDHHVVPGPEPHAVRVPRAPAGAVLRAEVVLEVVRVQGGDEVVRELAELDVAVVGGVLEDAHRLGVGAAVLAHDDPRREADHRVGAHRGVQVVLGATLKGAPELPEEMGIHTVWLGKGE